MQQKEIELSDYFKSFRKICNDNGFAVEAHQVET